MILNELPLSVRSIKCVRHFSTNSFIISHSFGAFFRTLLYFHRALNLYIKKKQKNRRFIYVRYLCKLTWLFSAWKSQKVIVLRYSNEERELKHSRRKNILVRAVRKKMGDAKNLGSSCSMKRGAIARVGKTARTRWGKTVNELLFPTTTLYGTSNRE